MKYFLLSLLVSILRCGICSARSCWECDNVFSHRECLRRGVMKKCRPSEDFCFMELRYGGWGNYPLIKKSCKDFISCGNNYVQNTRSAWSSRKSSDQIQCNDHSPSSVCRCCCVGDYCNYNKKTCARKEMTSECPDLPRIYHGVMKCFDRFNLLSVCKIICDRGFYVAGGNDTLKCGYFGKWDNPPPFCKQKSCRIRSSPKHGLQQCTRGSKLNSFCRLTSPSPLSPTLMDPNDVMTCSMFRCEQGYRLHGKPIQKCIELRNRKYAVWSGMKPTCKPLRCSSLKPFKNGKVRCSNKNYVGSTCSLSCNQSLGYVLNFPPGSGSTLKCQRNELWDKTAPCCYLPCPPYASMDFLVVLDSSSSVTKPNWDKTIKFVITFLREFEIREDSTQVGVFRYNSDVDQKNEIHFDDYFDDKIALLDAIQNIPYNGRGTNTGKALDYAREILSTRKRDSARKILLLITDGKSQDSVSEPALMLQQTDILIYVLPIKSENGKVNLQEIELIAKNPENILRDALQDGFKALDSKFAQRITSVLCRRSCF